jgi:hypothetical protein
MATISAAAISSTAKPTAAGRRKARLIAVVGAVLAALVVWALAKLAVSDLRQPAFGGATPQQLNATIVIVAASIGSLLGWSVMALLEHLTTRPRRFWAMIAPVALLISLAGPLSGHGVSGGNRLALVLMHVAVAGIIIPLLYRTSSSSEPAVRR